MSKRIKKCQTRLVSKLQHAVEFNDASTLKYLIKKGVNIDHTFKTVLTEHGQRRRHQTALFIAVRKNYKGLVQLLIDAGCNVNATDSRGETPLFVAVSKGTCHSVKTLVKSGASIQHLNNKSENVLFAAVESGHIDVIEYLIECGCSVDVRNNVGKTVLEIGLDLHILSYGSHAVHTRKATAHRKLVIVTNIIKASMDSKTLNEQFITAYAKLANAHGCVEIPKLLIQHGACPMIRNTNNPLLIVLHLNANYFCPRLVRLWYEAGLSLDRDIWLHTLDIPEWLTKCQDTLAELSQFARNTRSLKSLCRIKLRTTIQCPIWQMIDLLPVPNVLKDYLKLKEYDSITYTVPVSYT